MLKLIAILLVAVMAANAYDFSDSFYNEYIFDEFNALTDDILTASAGRQRRDTEEAVDGDRKCGRGDGERDREKDLICCGENKFNSEHFKMARELKKQCAMKLRANNSDVENFDPFDCEKMERVKQLIVCENECFGKAMKIIGEDGKLDRAVIMTLVKDNLVGDDEWKKSNYEAYVEKCLNKAEQEPKFADQKCSSAAMEFHHCLLAEFRNGCPADMRTVSPRCDRMRERKEGSSGFNKHLLHSFLHGTGHGHGHGRH